MAIGDISLNPAYLLRAHDCAARTRPSISAPLKFFVSLESSTKLTSAPSFSFSTILDVWILIICGSDSVLVLIYGYLDFTKILEISATLPSR